MLRTLLASAVLCSGLLGQGFKNVRVNSDNSGQLHNEEQIVANPLDPDNVVAVWRDFRLGYRRVGAGCSFDGGRTWRDTLLVDNHYPWHSDPGLAVDRAGNFYACILSFTSTSEPNGLFVQKSTDGGVTWDTSVTVVDEHNPSYFEDKQLIACDRGDSSPYEGNLYVAWARFYETSIRLCRSTDGNRSWSAPILVSDGSASRQWPTPAVGPNGEVYVAWCHLSSPLSIRFDRSLDGGVTWGTDRTVQNVSLGSGVIQPSVQVFSFPAMDVDITPGPRRGNIYMAYMDNAQSGGGQNIWFTRSTDRGNTWSARAKLNDDLDSGKDHFHPWLSCDANGDLTAAWYDRRLDPANTLMDIYLTQSTDGGATWTPNVRVTTVSSDPRVFPGADAYRPSEPKPLAGRLGEYNGLWAVNRGKVYAMWADTRDGSPNVYAGFNDTTVALQEEVPRWPAGPELSASPNPFSSAVRFCAPAGSIGIYTGSGRLIRTVATRVWDGCDDMGKRLPPGIYVAVARGCARPTKLAMLRR